MPHNTVHLFAPAKLNLFLHITGRQADMYHTLQSLMVFVDVGDALEIAPHDTLYIDIVGPHAAPLDKPKDNLVYKAAILLAESYQVTPRGKIILTKNLPVASGIGGGSSDAAVTLKGLVKLWDLPGEPGRLLQLAQKLGADVPACLNGKPVWAEGIGEKMTALTDMPELHFVLVNPMIQTPTAQVFERFGNRFSPPIQFSGRRKTAAEWIADLKIYRNDLTDAATSVTPVIRDVLMALAETSGGLLHRLSGSGATCFGIYSSKESAHAAAHVLKTRYPDWWVTTANMLK